MKKILSVALAVLMLVSVLPMSSMITAVEFNLGSGDCDYYNLIEKNDYNLAPGAVESEIIINDDSGTRRQVVHVVEVDPNNDNISVMPSFKNIGNGVDYTDTDNWGIMEMSKQAAYVENTLGKNVVGAMNVCLSWDFTHPYGLLVYEGEVLCDNRFSCDSCGNNGHPGGGYLVIYKDGKAELRDAKAPLTGEEWMAQTVCFSYLVKDGVSQHAKEDHKSDAAPRSVIGVKADGSLVIMMVDGRMAPYSTGFTNHEMAQMMLDLGCVDAINCDGGGSSTFITEREGTGELTVKSRFSDGSERPTLTGILIVSKAVADGKFHHAAIEADNKLVTPGSTVNFTATGADSAGGPADVPENVSWKLDDSSMGTIADGVFVSSGKTGSVTAQMVYEGNVVGEATIDVVIPDSFEFVMPNITAPYTKTVNLDLVAKYGHSEVALKVSDIEYTLSDPAMGTISGIKFTATSDETVKGGTVTATLVHNKDLVATANITLGKGSEIVYDFESGAESIKDWVRAYKSPYTPDKYYFNDELSVVSVEDGAKVRNGQYALKVDVDGDSITCMNWCQTKIQGMNIDLTDAVSLSFWIYIPEGSHGLEWDFGNAIPVVLGHEFQYGTGWQYLTVNVKDIGSNVTKLNEIRLYHSDTNNAGNGYNHYEHPNYYADVVYYIDDITVNYSSAVDDNDAPVISDACVSHANVDTPVAMKGQDIDTSLVTFTAKANDNVGNTNYTGLDLDSLIVLVDGNKINATCSENGLIATDNIDLANGVHTVVFKIADKNGNYNMYKEYSINIVGNDDKNTIKYVPADPTLKDVLQDSVVWMNLVATEIGKVSKVTTTIDLDQNSKWELDHMIVADGFSAEYTVDEENNDATITITATGNVELSGEAVLATLPVRVWKPAYIDGGNEDAKAYRLVSVMSYVQMGELVETDATVSTFASAMNTISTEWNSTRLTSTFDKGTWHIHTAVAMDDVAATCTANGYEGRTFCKECNSVVDWGTTLVSAGHIYSMVDGKLACECGDLFNGVYTDGKLYIDGTIVNNAWNGDSYYVNGEKVTGVKEIDGKYYNFGDDGVCANKYPISAEYWTNEKGETYYFNAGVPVTGYAFLNPNPAFFYANGVAFDGEIEIGGEICVFDKGVFVESTTADVILAGLAGPEAYFILYANGTLKLCGEGATYDYVTTGASYGEKISWKNRPWGNQYNAYSKSIKKVVVGKDITAIGVYTFYLCTNISSVTFEEGSKLKDIKSAAFCYLPYLKEVKIPGSVTNIANTAFAYCESLVNVYIPQDITYISDAAFNSSAKVVLDVASGTYGETYAKKNKIAYTVRDYEYLPVASGKCGDNATWAFYGNGELVISGSGAMDDYASQGKQPWADFRTQIKTIIIGKDITHIGQYAFAYSFNVKSVTFDAESKLESVGAVAFYYLQYVKSIDLPETVKTVGNLAFGYNTALVNVYVPQDITSISSAAFKNSTKVVLNVAKTSYAESYAISNGIAHTTREFVYIPVASGNCGANVTWAYYANGELVISGSGAMDDYASQGKQPWADFRTQIKSIVIGKDITHIGQYAFAYSFNVKSVTFEEGSKLNSIGAVAFYYLQYVKSIDLPETVYSIGNLAFGYCANLVNVYVPQNVKTISGAAFKNAPKVVLNVAKTSYAESYAISNGIDYVTRAYVYEAIASGECGANATWTLYNNGQLEISGSGAMDDYATQGQQPWADFRTQIKSIVIGKDITHVGQYAFAYAYNVSAITFEEGSKLESIGAVAFYYHQYVKKVDVPASVKSIDNLAFGYCAKLSAVTMGSNVSVHSKAFYNTPYGA